MPTVTFNFRQPVSINIKALLLFHSIKHVTSYWQDHGLREELHRNTGSQNEVTARLVASA